MKEDLTEHKNVVLINPVFDKDRRSLPGLGSLPSKKKKI